MGTSAGVEPRPIGDRHFKNVTHPVALFELVRVSERSTATVTDPVCRMQVAVDDAIATIVHEGVSYRFCSLECARLFSDTPGLYVDAAMG